MRLGIDCRLWNESGVGRYTRNLVKQLQILDQNNFYTLFVRIKDLEEVKSQKSKVKSNNWKIVVVDIRWHTLEEQLKFPSIINKENLDLMHFPYFSVPVFYNKPYVVTIHDLILHHFPTGLASNLPTYLYKLKLLGYKFVIKMAARKAEKIITVSNVTKSEIVDHLKVKPSKAEVTYEGIDDKIRNSKSEIRNKSKIINSKTIATKYFLYVGNAYPHKNLLRLIEAFAKIRMHTNDYSESIRIKKDLDTFGEKIRKNSDLKLLLVGKEDYFYRRLKQKVKKMHLEKSVLFYGEVSDEELVGLYKNALALVMPSLMEGFGLAGLEAMANKCLVLASDIPSLHEVYENAAIFFDPYDVYDIERKMIEVLRSEVKHDFVGQGLERTKMFSWEKMARETLEIYENCIKS